MQKNILLEGILKMKIRELQNHLASFDEELEVYIRVDGDTEEFGEVPILEMPIKLVGGQYSTRTDRTSAIVIVCKSEDSFNNK